jgi:L-iditol 2-dehydrogenase
VRVAAVGLCGTDIHIFRGEGNYNMDATGRVIPLEEQPQILGHEFCGEVAEVGSQARGFEPGERIVVDQGHNCHSAGRASLCEYCQTGDSHQCVYYRDGITGLQGAMAEFVAVPSRMLSDLGDLLLEAAPAELLGCICIPDAGKDARALHL